MNTIEIIVPLFNSGKCQDVINLFSAIIFHGHIISNDPKMNPVSKARTQSLKRLNNQDIICEKPNSPTTEPKIKTNK